MEKAKQFIDSKKFTYLVIISGVLLLLYTYVKNVLQINTVWELVDEYGYLANAAYMSGTEWAWVSNSYYGYGYSIWLVPFFWLCNSGTRMIQGAIFVNAMCVVALFIVQIVLMKKICKSLSENMVVLVSFVLCLYPYLFVSGMKVVSECLLVLMIWLCGLLLYQALTTEKWYYYALTASATVYTFFVHTRAFIFCAAVVLILLIMLTQKSVNVKNFVIFCVVGGTLLALGYILKNELIDVVYSASLFQSDAPIAEGVTAAVGNTLTLKYMLQRIVDMLANFSVRHVFTFACKNFYLLVATAGMFHIGIGYIAKDVVAGWKQAKKLTNEDALKLMYAVAAIVMIFALIINSPGNPDKPAYYFYGRYYEYLIGPIVFVGIEKVSEKRITPWVLMTVLILLLISEQGTLQVDAYLNNPYLYFDSNRMASFAYCAYEKIMYGDVVRYWFGFTVIVIVIVFVLNYFEKLRKMILVVPLIMFLLNNMVIEGTIVQMHQNNTDFYEIATFIHSNYDVDEVYFLSGDSIERVSYAGVQSLLGQEELIVIKTKDSSCLETGDLVVTYRYNSPIEQLELPISSVGETEGYAIYLVQ